MLNSRKYAIIVLSIIIVLVSSKILCAAEILEPGVDLPDNSDYGIETNEEVGGFWAGWVPIHFGEDIDARLRPGDYSGSNVIYVDRSEGRAVGTEAVKGYGLYQFTLEKHMVGYLYFIKDKVNDSNKTSILKTKGTLFSPDVYYKPREACKVVADLLMSTAYSVDSQNLLHVLLKNIESQNSAINLKKWQSEYWYKVYGDSGYILLRDILDGKIVGHDREIKGAVLSITSDRYRNKTLKNKTNIRLSVDKGDLWPFLVYTKTSDNGNTIIWKYDDYMIGADGKKKEYETSFDDLIRGAYYYMVYYEYKYDYEGDIEKDTDIIYNSTKVDMYIREYEALTGKRFVELTGEALDDFYQKVRSIRRIYKKSAENGSALFGEEEDYSINSDITYKRAMDKIAEKMSISPFKEIFKKSLSEEYIARTYLMAKNIAENQRLRNQTAQYDIGSNILSRTPGGNDDTVLLTDLQKIKLNRNGKEFSNDTDNDGLKDNEELDKYEQHDITDFVEHLLKAESGLNDVSTLMENYKNNIKLANADKTKQNLVEGQRDITVVGDRIKVYLYSYKSNPIMKDTDFDGLDDKNDNLKLDNSILGQISMSNNNTFNVNTHMDYRYFFMDEYNYYDELAAMSFILSQSVYNRNTTDLTNINTIKEKIGLERFSAGVSRIGATDDTISPYINETINGVKYETNYAVGYKTIEYSKDNSGNNYIKKIVIPIVIPGMIESSNTKSYSEIGKPNWASDKNITNKLDNPDSHNVQSYEIYANLIKNSIYEVLQNDTKYKDYISNGYKPVYWVTGYKEGGAIANILSAKLRDMGQQVYAYTFASPMTIYNNADEKGYTRTGYSARYDSIFNVVNEDDPYAFLMSQELGFSRYGKTCFGNGHEIMNIFIEYKGNKEVKDEIIKYFNMIYKDKKLKDQKNKARTFTYDSEDYKETFTIKKGNKTIKTTYKTVQDYITAFIDIMNKNRAKTLEKTNVDSIDSFCQRGSIANNIKVFKNKLKVNYEKIKRAGEEDVYYTLARYINNADIVNVVNSYDKKEHKIKENEMVGNANPQELMAEAIEVMGQMYVKNVSTYGSNRYSLEEVSKDVDSAYVKNQYNTLTNADISEQKEEIKQKFESLINENDWFKCGDDCVRFMFSVIFYANNGDLGLELSDNNSETYYTMFGNNALVKNTNDKLFEDLGFKIYYIGEVDEKGHEFGYKDLEDGDIVIAYRTDSDEKGHVEFYINDRYGKNGNGTYDWSFGWGDIRKRYPINGCIGKIIQIDDSQNEQKKKYLLDNFSSKLRYFKVLRKVK